MIASLMMYDRVELATPNAAYWRQLRHALNRRGIKTPKELANTTPEFEVWRSPELVLSQTCGMPYRTQLSESVSLIGTPDFGLEGCAPGYYRSAVVVRQDDPREAAEFCNARFVYNQRCSQSGFGAAFFWARDHGFRFDDCQASGGHVASARMVAQGHADIATIDAQSWRFIQQFDGFAKDLRVLDWTAPTPGLPYIAAKGVDARARYEAVAEAIAALDPLSRQVLGLRGIVAIPKAAYLAVENPPDS
ncbi:PhnD/SsuA/transferrin family substrate-binding protein [Sulfitobacter sp. F26204]|uniref:phosphate/phosphite/phosphonate ABC transporter substrate-binding protein n=1 Tax=Sulfitobacter sp. F26204 TaxID=2996014 RepID=UPI00225E4D94|nr:PhnD/SsuA/transferrin family substrate-binding protein [Sulfitobacter sp. F26204]MCX7557968.1 PhnD/SsuA/transferrin family substrate-binding protein [Sulfitobacter sp. F26204]